MNRLHALFRRWWRFAAIVVLPIVIVAFFLARLANTGTAREAIVWVQQIAREWWFIPLYLGAYTLCATFLLPVTVLSVASALAWGWKMGATLELLALTAASFVPFRLAHGRAAAWIERRLRSLGSATPSFEGEHGTFALLLLRIVPILPYVALNYVAGLARVRTRDYLWTTLIGSIPSTFVFAYFVDTLAAGAMGMATQARIVGACLAVAAMAIAARWVARRFDLVKR